MSDVPWIVNGDSVEVWEEPIQTGDIPETGEVFDVIVVEEGLLVLLRRPTTL